MTSPVISRTVGSGMCIGCGMCAALCPHDVLRMEWNARGEYNPVERAKCEKECGLCAKVCPFIERDEDEDAIGERLFGNIPGMAHRPETGYYLASYIGYSDVHRPTSASGGIAT